MTVCPYIAQHVTDTFFLQKKEPLKHAVPFDKVYCALATEAAEYQVRVASRLFAHTVHP